MPIRSRSHILEEESIRRFHDALPSGWVYRGKAPDYGIDGEVELFDPEGSSTGISFNVQLRATDDAARADRVRLEVDELDYYRSLDTPTAVIRYGSPHESLVWQWASNIASSVEIAENQKTVTYHFSEDERWTETTPAAIRRTLEVRRHLANYPPDAAVALRLDLSAIPAVRRYPLDRIIAGAISESRGALVRAATHNADVEAFARLEPGFLTVGIDTLTGVTFDMVDPTPDDYLASTLYALVHLFRQQRLTRQAEALALFLVDRELAHHDSNLAFDACMALTSDLPALVDLAIINGLHDLAEPMHALVSLSICKARQHDEATRGAAMDVFFEATLTSAEESESTSIAAAHYSIGNFYRSQNDLVRAITHYNHARRLRPAYLQASYFLRELAGVLFLAGHYVLAELFYHEAARLDPDDSFLSFLLGDAHLLSGKIAQARACFNIALASCNSSRLQHESELKIAFCDYLIASSGADTVPRRRYEANGIIRSDGRDSAEHLEYLLSEIDALNPLARFNLGIIRARESDRNAALHHFLACAFIQPQDIAAWANAAICAVGLGDESLLLRILGTAIHHMGADAYDYFRADVAAQGMPTESLALLDGIAMQMLEESELSEDDSFTLRILDGDDFHSMKVVKPD
ncbi:DUF4365 domain-containing protein [Parasphingorhabdus flavimaris]|uniref:DUF4365 domain-containing protein n=1 Tax=Parasphingorhabdus flavimaris TaxID=266812 RepID=UPI0030038934